jgi:hypothetical protein
MKLSMKRKALCKLCLWMAVHARTVSTDPASHGRMRCQPQLGLNGLNVLTHSNGINHQIASKTNYKCGTAFECAYWFVCNRCRWGTVVINQVWMD